MVLGKGGGGTTVVNAVVSGTDTLQQRKKVGKKTGQPINKAHEEILRVIKLKDPCDIPQSPQAPVATSGGP